MKTLAIQQNEISLKITETGDKAVCLAISTPDKSLKFDIPLDDAAALADFIYQAMFKHDKPAPDAMGKRIDKLEAQLDSLMLGLNIATQHSKHHVN